MDFLVIPLGLTLGLYNIIFTSRVTGMTRVLGRSKLWGNGYTTVPVLVRRLLDIREGGEIEWILNENNEIIIKKV